MDHSCHQTVTSDGAPPSSPLCLTPFSLLSTLHICASPLGRWGDSYTPGQREASPQAPHSEDAKWTCDPPVAPRSDPALVKSMLLWICALGGGDTWKQPSMEKTDPCCPLSRCRDSREANCESIKPPRNQRCSAQSGKSAWWLWIPGFARGPRPLSPTLPLSIALLQGAILKLCGQSRQALCTWGEALLRAAYCGILSCVPQLG